MKENQFIVDLGSMKLTEADRGEINSAIQKAVAGEIANLNFKNRVALVPVTKWPRGPIINGIIARELTEKVVAEIIG